MSAQARGRAGARRAALCGLFAVASLSAGCWEVPSQAWYDSGTDGGRGDCDAACCGAGCCDTADCGVRPRERACDDEMDNDNDGLEDCADSDCSDRSWCCADGESLFREDWGDTDLTTDWDQLPQSPDPPAPAFQMEHGVTTLNGWGEDATRHTLVRRTCVPLALGAVLTFELIAVARDSRCQTLEVPCDRHASVVLSRVRDTSPGQALLEELAIRVHGHGRVSLGGEFEVLNQAMVRVTRAGAELARILIEPGVRYLATLTMTPSSEGSLAHLSGDLALQRCTSAPGPCTLDPVANPPVQSVPFFVVAQEQLVRGTNHCMGMGGLYAAVEMVGDRARLGPIQAQAFECVNPSQFQPVPENTTTLTSESLGVPASYGGAYIGSPTLGTSLNNPLDEHPRWDLFFEATNQAPEVPVAVGYAIGHSRSLTFGAQPVDWTTSASPRLGSDPPSCPFGDVCTGPSVRDPFLLVRRGADDVLQDFTLAFAAATEAGGYGLRVQPNVAFSPSAALGGDGMALNVADPDCVDLRDPALVPVGGSSSDYWLFFTCVRANEVGEIRAARFNSAFELQGNPSGRTVISPASVGALADQGVFGAEPIVRSSDAGLTLLIWAVARDVAGTYSLVLMTGQVPAVEVPDGGVSEAPTLDTLPTLYPYLANPVLRSNDAALGGCTGLCRITGAAVSDTVDEPEVLRFVVARRVVDSEGNTFSELVPLIQTWRLP